MHYRDWAFKIDKDTPSIVAKDPATCDVKSDNDLLNKQYQCSGTGSIPTFTGTGTYKSHESYGTDAYAVSKYWVEYIKVAEGNTIEFSFTGQQFGLEAHNTCAYDWVKIVDGND